MNSLLLAVIAFVGYLAAYRVYGRYVSQKLFRIDSERPTPAHVRRDDVDYVPTRGEVLFGHHYTSIAGTGPIVGPAVGIIWGWLPAFLWVLFGPILIGAIHDFGALVISLRNEGQTIGDTAGKLISPRVRLLLQILLFFLLLLVIAIFGMVIANIFFLYPQSVIPIWAEIPIAMVLGHAIYKRDVAALPASIVAVAAMYLTIVIGARYPIELAPLQLGTIAVSPLVIWTIVLMAYAYVASILPVWRLLQPRDYINGHELYIVLTLLGLGIVIVHPPMVAPALRLHPEGAPPMFPALFILIACGAVSGFHSLVSSGTTSKQLDKETDALPISFGGMLLEGFLAVIVLIACGAGLGLAPEPGMTGGSAAWFELYGNWGAAQGLKANLTAFVNGSGNILAGLGISHNLALTVMGVFVASFAGTTLDTAARIQRYIVSEIAAHTPAKVLTRTHPATFVAVGSGLLIAMVPTVASIHEKGLLRAMLADGGQGGKILWPLFGAGNQLLASLGLLVATVYLLRQRRPLAPTGLPMLFMIGITLWAMSTQMIEYFDQGQWHLFVIGGILLLLDVWMIAETALTLRRPIKAVRETRERLDPEDQNRS